MKIKNIIILIGVYSLCFFATFESPAQLAVTVYLPKAFGQRVVVPLTLKDEMTNEVEAARAICLLSDQHGKMVGQSTKWVIGENNSYLGIKDQAKFFFVITVPQSIIASNLTAKVIFTRVILDNGSIADLRSQVIVRNN